MNHDRSAHNSTRTQILNAEDRALDVGIDIGMERRRQLDIDGLEAHGFTDAAAWLREAKVVETGKELS